MTTKAKSHVGLTDNVLICRNCGATYTVNMPCEIDIWAAIVKTFDKSHKGCTVQAGSPAARDADPPGTMTPDQWLQSGDCGTSSATIWSVMTGRGRAFPTWGPSAPRDPDDLGRCIRLLDRFPTWRPRLQEVADEFPEMWGGFIAAWDELESLYRVELPTGKAPNLYARMKAIRGVE